MQRNSLIAVWMLLLGCVTGVQAAGLGIVHWQTGNGAKVYFVPSPDLPMLDIEVVFNAGGARDKAMPGLAKLTNALLDQGAGQRNADQIAESMDSVGAQLGNDSLRDMAIVTLRTLTDPEFMNPALAVFADIVQAPTFPEEDLQRLKQQMLLILEKIKESPDDIASQAFYAAVYGDHPYGQPDIGTQASIEAMTREQVLAFYRQYYVANNAVLAMVGNASLEQAHAIAEQIVGKLPAGNAAEPLPPVKALTEARTIHIEYPSAQSHVYVGQVGMDRTEADYLPLYIGNHILGGSGLVSILAEQVREQRGLSYSVSSSFSPMAQKGPFMANLQTRNDQVDTAVTVLKDTMRDYIAKGPSDQQLSDAINNITGGFALRVDSNSKILQYLAMIGFYGLPLDYVDTFIDRTRAVTLGGVRTALQAKLNPDAMVTVIVGQTPHDEQAQH